MDRGGRSLGFRHLGNTVRDTVLGTFLPTVSPLDDMHMTHTHDQTRLIFADMERATHGLIQ